MSRWSLIILTGLAMVAGAAQVSRPARVQRIMAVAPGFVADGYFVTTWVVTNGASITLPLRSGYTYDMTVDYGDGTVVNVNSNNDPDATHQYTSGDSNRTVAISGTMGAWYFNNGGSKASFRGVTNWGGVSTTSTQILERAFYSCSAATTFTNTILRAFTDATTLAYTWANCSGARAFPLDLAPLSNVTTLANTWIGCAGVKNGFPAVSNLTKIASLASTWESCSGNTNTFPDVDALTNVTTLFSAWSGCSGATTFPAISTLTKVTTLASTWKDCSGVKNGFPAVSNLTQVTTLASAWQSCSGNTNGFPAVNALTKVTTLANAWLGCSASYFSVESVLGDCLWMTGQVKSVSLTFRNNNRMTGNGMTLVNAFTNQPGFPTGYTYNLCFNGCTNLTDYATIPADWK